MLILYMTPIVPISNIFIIDCLPKWIMVKLCPLLLRTQTLITPVTHIRDSGFPISRKSPTLKEGKPVRREQLPSVCTTSIRFGRKLEKYQTPIFVTSLYIRMKLETLATNYWHEYHVWRMYLDECHTSLTT